MPKQKEHIVAVLKALGIVFLWATSWVLIKIGLDEIPALTFAGIRYSLAFICLVPVVLFTQDSESCLALSKREWGQLLILGLLLYALTQGAQFLALAHLPAVTVNLLWSFSSVAVAIMGVLWLAEQPSQLQWIGLRLATLGGVVYFLPLMPRTSQWLGIIAALVGILANAGAVIVGRHINRAGNISPLFVTFISMGMGSIPLLLAGISIHELPHLTLQSWIIIGWLALVNTAFAFTIWNQTLRTLPAMESSIINGTMLLWIPLLAILFLGESISVKELVGLVFVAAGTLLVQLRQPAVLST